MKDKILIVGAGPVGLSQAMALVKKGIPVTVIEQEPKLTTIPKASTIHPPTLEIFKEWGVIEKVEKKSYIVENFQYWDRRNREIIADLKLNLLKEDTKFPYRYQCEQHELTQIFYDELIRSNLATIHLNTKLVDLVQNDDQVEVHMETNGEVKTNHFDYVIGADGASSIVRKKLEIPFEGLTYPQNHLLICVENHDFTEDYQNLAPVSYFFHPTEWVALIRNISYWKFLLPLEKEMEENIDDAYLQQRIRNFTGNDEKVYDIFHWVVYKAHQRVASSYLKGRCVLIGDAAHINNPLGGMGMNSGIHDAYYLADYIEKIYYGDASIDVLKEFEAIRQNNAKEVVQKITIKNEETARQTDSMKQKIDEMKILNENDEAAREYLLESSMIKGFKYAHIQ